MTDETTTVEPAETKETVATPTLVFPLDVAPAAVTAGATLGSTTQEPAAAIVESVDPACLPVPPAPQDEIIFGDFVKAIRNAESLTADTLKEVYIWLKDEFTKL